MKNKVGAIIDGVYYPDIDKVPNVEPDSVTYKGYNHDKQRKEHARDIIQPYINGKPNPKFIEQYPNESKDYGFIK